MKIGRIEKQLTKINRLVEACKLDGKLDPIEKDLLLDYVKRLYDEIYFDDEEKDIVPQQKIVEKPTYVGVKEIVEKEIVADKEPPQEEVLNTVITEEVETINDDLYDSLFEMEEAVDFASKLSMSKINDLNSAISINERMFTIRELFGGDNQEFNKYVNSLNDATNFGEAKKMLIDEIIPKYDWLSDEKVKKAQNFIKLVIRRFS